MIHGLQLPIKVTLSNVAKVFLFLLCIGMCHALRMMITLFFIHQNPTSRHSCALAGVQQ